MASTSAGQVLKGWLRWPRGLRGWQRARRPLVLHGFGLDDLAWQELQPLLKRLARELKLDLSLALHQGDVVLIDPALRSTVSPHLLQAFAEGRPLLEVAREAAAPGRARGAVDAAALREQLLAMVQRGGRDAGGPGSEPASSAFASAFDGRGELGEDSGFDSRHPGALSPDMPLAEAEARFLDAVHAGKADPERPPLVGGYGADAMLMLDFAGGVALMQPAAVNALRLGARLPRVAGDWAPGRDVMVRELDLVLWELGWAAGQHALLGADEDWWHTPLVPLRLHVVMRHSAAPLHREIARVLARGGVTPSQLRRECLAGVIELRCFLQACLFLALLRWPANPGAPA